MSERFRNATPRVEQAPKTLNPEELHVFGAQYRQCIDRALGRVELSVSEVESLPPKLRMLVAATERYCNENEEVFTERNMSAKDLLSQAFPKPEQLELLSNETEYRLEKLAKGMYVVLLDPQLINKLRPGIAAVAYKGEGAQFICVQEYRNPGDQKRNLEENIPHEAHHLLWNAAQKEDLFPITERDIHLRASFKVFQDELIARASSGGGLGGYHHLNKLSPEQRIQLEEEMPGHAEQIIERVSNLNELLTELQDLLSRSKVITSADMLELVISSTNFDELEQNLHRFKELVEANPLEDSVSPGWGFA